MRIICFLRELGLPIDSISQLLSESDPGSVISLLLQQQEQALKKEIAERQEKLKKIHMTMLMTGIPISVLQWTSIILWITKGIWQPFLVWVIVVIPYALLFSRWYFRKTAYICPQCHSVFQPSIKEGFWARHTYSARKLTCPSCGHHGFCVEVAREEDIHG